MSTRMPWLAVFLCLVMAGTLAAQVDPRGHWQTWHTTHFRIHARAENEQSALRAAAEAERAYAALSSELHPARGIIDVVLYDNVDFANGYTTVLPSNRISVFLTPPAGEIGLAHYDDWLRLALTHELTHVFHLDRSRGVWGFLQHIFGRAPPLFPNLYRPAWVGEGLATYYESRFTGAGRQTAAFHDQIVRARAAAGRWPRPGDVNLSTSHWPGGTGPYAFGSRFFGQVAALHGDSVLPRFVENTASRLWPLTVSGPLRQAGAAGLDQDWRTFAARYSDDAGVSGRLIARGLRAEPRPRLSPDGGRLAYIQSDGRTQEQIVVRDVATGDTVARRGVNSSPEIAWAGENLVFAELDYTSPVEIRSALFRWSLRQAPVRVTPVERLTRPFALPDGVGAVALGPATTALVRIRGDRLDSLAVPDADAWSHVAVSPDGRYFAGSRHLHGRWDIVVWPAGDPAGVQSVTDDPMLDDDPAWGADGNTLTFTSERAGLPQVYAWDVRTRALSQLTSEPNGAREGQLAADGSIFFTTILDDGYAVASSAAVPLAPAPAIPDSQPAVPAPAPVPLRRTGYAAWPSLAPRFWLPLFHTEAGVGDFLGAATAGSDAVGRTSYALALAHATGNGRWETFFSLSHTRWSWGSVSLVAQQVWDVGGVISVPGGPGILVSERDRSLTAGATVEHRRWRSLVSAGIRAELTQDAFFAPGAIFSNPVLAGGVASFSAGTSHEQALSISAENGVRINGAYRRRWAFSGGGSDDLRGTLRAYVAVPLPGFARWVVAGRIAGAVSGGRYARNFAMGGEPGGSFEIVPGLGFGAGEREFAMRGYPRDASRFTRVVVGAAEVRIPLFLIGRAVGKLPVAVDKVSLSLFGETGGGWRAEAGSRRLDQYRDIGAELVVDVGLNLDAPFRFRFGAARALTSGLGANRGDWRAYVALGSAF